MAATGRRLLSSKPDLVIFVMDSSIGQAQAELKQSDAVGAVIITKMDGHAKRGGGVKCLMWYLLELEKHINKFEVFDVKPFVRRLLGMGEYWSGFMDKRREAVREDQQPELLQKVSQGELHLEDYVRTSNSGIYWKWVRLVRLITCVGASRD